MKQADTTRFPSLDGLRGASIIMVLGAHAAGRMDGAVRDAMNLLFNGEVGVRIFFVISGFLITALLLSEKERDGSVSLSRFYLRRFIRLAPVQWAFLAVLFALTMTTGLQVTGCQFLTSLTYTKNIACGSWIDGHFWSLSVEEQFYLLWPIAVAAIGAIARFRLAIALIVMAPLFRVYFYVNGMTGERLFSFMSNMDALMIGCVAAAIWRDGRLKLSSKWRSASRLAALVAIYLTLLGGHFLVAGKFLIPFGPTVQAISAAFLIVSLQREPIGLCHQILNNRVLVVTGMLSYSLYVWQQIFFSTPETFGVAQSLLLSFPTNLLALSVVATASYFAFERGLQGLRHRLH